jgi:hypothetical protein
VAKYQWTTLVAIPDINNSPTQRSVVPPCKNTPVKGLEAVPGAVDPEQALCMTPPRPVLHCTSKDGTVKKKSCADEGPLTLERSKNLDEEISAQVNDLKRDPFERSVASADGTLLGYGGALAASSTAYIHDWNLLPTGQLLPLKELETYRTFPSLQVPASYDLDQMIEAMQSAKHISHAGE